MSQDFSIISRLHAIVHAQSGRSLPAVLVAIGVGSILLGPFLSHVSTRMLASRDVADNLGEQYAVDAGAEFASWKILYDSAFRATLDANVGTAYSITPDIVVNGETTSIEVTALPPGEWTAMADALGNVFTGGALAEDGGYIYGLRGGGSSDFWRYDIAADTWSDFAVSNAPSSVDAGGSLAHESGGNFFALRGGGSNDAWEYDPGADNWDDLNGFPGGVGDGGAITYSSDHDHLYGFRGSNSNAFRRYRFSGSGPGPPPMWIGAPAAPENVDSGGSLASAGDFVYALQGGGSAEFWRFEPGSGGAGSWSTGGDDPSDPPNGVDAGAALASDGGNFIYALRGNATTDFWRYDIGVDAWQTLASTPAPVGGGGALTHAGGSDIYAFRGNGTTDFWRFRITPPRYDIHVVAGDTSLDTRVEVVGSEATVLFWDIE